MNITQDGADIKLTVRTAFVNKETFVLDEENRARFESKIDKSPHPNECWVWIGGKNDDGYGQFSFLHKTYSSHRVSYYLNIGPIPDGLCVCHSCDNPPCVNPAHFFLGTRKDNNVDRHAKGRTATGEQSGSRLHPERVARGDKHGSHTHPEAYIHGQNHWLNRFPERRKRGSNHPIAKLTEQKVVEIRARYKPQVVTHRMLAEEYGVSRDLIMKVVKRELWTHI